MTADERIEKLLNRFGQTISDLPKPEESNKYYTYSWHTKQNLHKAARKWDGIDNNHFSWDVVGDYACHLCDVIDRMEIALETAAKWAECSTCAIEYLEECEGSDHCDYRICDCYLRDEMTKEEVDALDEDH